MIYSEHDANFYALDKQVVCFMIKIVFSFMAYLQLSLCIISL